MLIKPLQLSFRLGMPWLLPTVLSAQACLAPSSDSSQEQDPGAIWGGRRQPGSRALLAPNTPRQAHLNLHGKPQSFQSHGQNRASVSLSFTTTCPKSSALPAGVGDKDTTTHWAGLRGEHSSVTPLFLAWAFKGQGQRRHHTP